MDTIVVPYMESSYPWRTIAAQAATFEQYKDGPYIHSYLRANQFRYLVSWWKTRYNKRSQSKDVYVLLQWQYLVWASLRVWKELSDFADDKFALYP